MLAAQVRSERTATAPRSVAAAVQADQMASAMPVARASVVLRKAAVAVVVMEAAQQAVTPLATRAEPVAMATQVPAARVAQEHPQQAAQAVPEPAAAAAAVTVPLAVLAVLVATITPMAAAVVALADITAASPTQMAAMVALLVAAVRHRPAPARLGTVVGLPSGSATLGPILIKSIFSAILPQSRFPRPGLRMQARKVGAAAVPVAPAHRDILALAVDRAAIASRTR